MFASLHAPGVTTRPLSQPNKTTRKKNKQNTCECEHQGLAMRVIWIALTSTLVALIAALLISPSPLFPLLRRVVPLTHLTRASLVSRSSLVARSSLLRCALCASPSSFASLVEAGVSCEAALLCLASCGVSVGRVEGCSPWAVLCDVATWPGVKESVVEALLGAGQSARLVRRFCEGGGVSERSGEKALEFFLWSGANASEMLPVFVVGDRRDVVEMLVSKRGANANAGMPMAAFHSKMDMLGLLLAHGADANEGIRLAATVQVLELLIGRGADPSGAWGVLVNREGSANNDAIECILSHGASVDDGLVAAALAGNRDVIDFLMRRGANIDKALGHAADLATAQWMLDKYSAHPSAAMALFALKKPREMVDLLLQRGADPSQGIAGALQSLRRDVLALLLERGADREVALAEAVEHDQGMQQVEMLLEMGAADSDAVLVAATRFRRLDIMELALARGASATRAMWTACHCDSYEFYDKSQEEEEMIKTIPGYKRSGKPPAPSRVALVKFLLDAGADPNAGIAEASIGRCVQSEDVVKLLLAHGANANLGVEVVSATHAAPILTALLDAGGDPNLGVAAAASIVGSPTLAILLERGGDANKGMEAACARGWADNVKLLLRKGADAALCVEKAAKASLPGALEALLDTGALKPTDELALKSAIAAGNMQSARLLLHRGADGQVAIALARAHGYVSPHRAAMIEQIESAVAAIAAEKSGTPLAP